MTIKRKSTAKKSGLLSVRIAGTAPSARGDKKPQERGPKPPVLKSGKGHTTKGHKKGHKGHGKVYHAKRTELTVQMQVEVMNFLLAALQGGPFLLGIQEIAVQVYWQLQFLASVHQAQPGSYQRQGGF